MYFPVWLNKFWPAAVVLSLFNAISMIYSCYLTLRLRCLCFHMVTFQEITFYISRKVIYIYLVSIIKFIYFFMLTTNFVCTCSLLAILLTGINHFDKHNPTAEDTVFTLIICILVAPISLKMHFKYYKLFAYIYIPLICALIITIFVGRFWMEDASQRHDYKNDTEKYDWHEDPYFIFYSMFPIISFAYNLEIAVMPVHCSFEVTDKTGNFGFKVSIICVSIAFFYYLIIALSPYSKEYVIYD